MKLIIEDDEGRKTVVPLLRDDVEITIGRQEGNVIRLTERNVSRKHARLIRKNGSTSVEDLGSYNGVKVNGDRIKGAVALKEGDLVQIGDYDLAIQVEDPKVLQAPAASTATPSTGPASPSLADETTGEHTIPQGDDSDKTPTTAAALPGLSSAPPPTTSPGLLVPKKHDETAIISSDKIKGARMARKVIEIAAEDAPRLLLTTTGREYACNRTELRIGRDENNDIAIDHRSLSRDHCKLVRSDDGEWRVIDLESANGVRVNGETYAQSAITPGDVLELGHLRFVFLAPGDEAPALASSVLAPIKRTKSMAILVLASAIIVVAGAGTGGLYIVTRPKSPMAAGTQTSPAATSPSKTVEEESSGASSNTSPASGSESTLAAARGSVFPSNPAASAPPNIPSSDPKSLRNFEKGKEAFAQGKFAEAEKRFGRAKDMAVTGAGEWLEKTRAELEAEKNLQEAQRRLAAGDLARALEAVEAVPPTTSGAAKAKALKALITAPTDKKGRTEESASAKPKADDEKKATRHETAPLSPDDRKALAGEAFNQGVTFFGEKKYKEAINLFQKTLESDPTYAEAHLYLGASYAFLNDSRKGAWHYEEFVHLAPNHRNTLKAINLLREFYAKSGGIQPRYPLPP